MIGVGQEYEGHVDLGNNGIADGHEHKPALEANPAAKAKRAPRRRKTPHVFAALNRFRDYGANAGGLGPTERLIWILIWSHVDSASGLSRISYQALEQKAGLGLRQCQRTVQALLESGYLQLVERGSAKCWACNVYRVISAPSESLSSVIGDAK